MTHTLITICTFLLINTLNPSCIRSSLDLTTFDKLLSITFFEQSMRNLKLYSWRWILGRRWKNCYMNDWWWREIYFEPPSTERVMLSLCGSITNKIAIEYISIPAFSFCGLFPCFLGFLRCNRLPCDRMKDKLEFVMLFDRCSITLTAMT